MGNVFGGIGALVVIILGFVVLSVRVVLGIALIMAFLGFIGNSWWGAERFDIAADNHGWFSPIAIGYNVGIGVSEFGETVHTTEQ